MAKTNVRFFLKTPPIFYYLLPPHSCHSTHLGLGAIVLFTSESSNAQLGPNQGQTWPIAKWGLSCQNTRRVNEDWRLNWRDMNIAQKLWDSTVGSHSWTGSTPHPLNSNPGTNIVPPSTASLPSSTASSQPTTTATYWTSDWLQVHALINQSINEEFLKWPK